MTTSAPFIELVSLTENADGSLTIALDIDIETLKSLAARAIIDALRKAAQETDDT